LRLNVGRDRKDDLVKTLTRLLAAAALGGALAVAVPSAASAADWQTCAGVRSTGFSCTVLRNNAFAIDGYYNGTLRGGGFRSATNTFKACDDNARDTIRVIFIVDMVGPGGVVEIPAPTSGCSSGRVVRGVSHARLVFKTPTRTHGSTWYALPGFS
jgi:hypothetical protein